MRPQGTTAQAGPDESGERRFWNTRFAGGPRPAALGARAADRTGGLEALAWAGCPRDGRTTVSGEDVTVHSENKFATKGTLQGTSGLKGAIRIFIYVPWNANGSLREKKTLRRY